MKKIIKITIFLLLYLILLSACSPSKVKKPEEIMVFAASSMTESMTELGKAFEDKEQGKIKVFFNFAGSQLLKTSVEAGTKSDIFISANISNMQELKNKGFVTGYRVFLKNKLVVIKNRKSVFNIFKLKDLATNGIKIAVGDKSVPVGNYWETALKKAFDGGILSKNERLDILKNIKTSELNDKDIVSKVLLDEVDVGVVYKTDVTKENSSEIEEIEIPQFENYPAEYTVAILKESEGSEAVKKFYSFIISDIGRNAFKRYGFIT